MQWEKFRFHNSQWLEMVKNQQAMEAALSDGDENGAGFYSDGMADPSCLYQLSNVFNLLKIIFF